jgi:MCM P-loop domain
MALYCTVEAYEGDQLRQLVAALCPTIYGHELVKAGLLLSLFGGVRKHAASINRVRVLLCVVCAVVGRGGSVEVCCHTDKRPALHIIKPF